MNIATAHFVGIRKQVICLVCAPYQHERSRHGHRTYTTRGYWPGTCETGSLISHPTEAENASERLTSLGLLPPGHPFFPAQAVHDSALMRQVTLLSCSVLFGLGGLRRRDVVEAVKGLGWWGGKKRAWRGLLR